MEEESGKGLWIGLIVAALIAVAFAILWFMRGGDMEQLRRDIASSRSAYQRLESELRDSKTQADSSARRLVEMEERLRDESRRAADNLAGLERRLRSELDISEQRLSSASAELERLRAEAGDGASGAVERIRAEMQAEVDKAAAEAARLRDEAAELKKAGANEIARLKAELETARKSKTTAADGTGLPALSAAAADGGGAERALKDDLAKLSEELEAARTEAATMKDELETAKAELQALRDAAARHPASPAAEPSQGETGEAEAQPQAEDLEKAKAEGESWKVRAAALRQALDSLSGRHAEAVKAQRQSEAAAAGLSQELEAVKAQAVKAIADVEQAWRARLIETEEAAAEVLSLARKEAADQLSVMARVSEEKQAELRQSAEAMLAAEQDRAAEVIASLEKAGVEKDRRLELLQNSYMKLAAQHEEAEAKYKKETAGLREEIGKLEKIAAEYGPGGAKFGLQPSGRTVGQIVDRINDGRIMLTDTGSSKGVRTGMKFDVYHPVGEGNRYVGMVKVIRALPDAAMLVSSYDEVIPMVCPRTGRPVLEPGARFSPFAVDGDGKAIALQPADKVGIPLEAPAIGDLLDNPFFDPGEKKIIIAVPEALAADPCVIKTVEGAGSIAKTSPLGTRPDYRLVDKDVNPSAEGPRPVTLDHVARYYDRTLQ